MNELSISDERAAPRPGHSEKGRFVAGNTFSVGRPKGSRNKLGEKFVDDLYQDWQEGGIEAIRRMRRDNPTAYVQTVARVLPKQLEVDVSHTDGLSDEQWDELVSYAQQRIIELKANPVAAVEPSDAAQTRELPHTLTASDSEGAAAIRMHGDTVHSKQTSSNDINDVANDGDESGPGHGQNSSHGLTSGEQ